MGGGGESGGRASKESEGGKFHCVGWGDFEGSRFRFVSTDVKQENPRSDMGDVAFMTRMLVHGV